MSDGLSLPEKILAIHEQLTRMKTPHAFGGALALAYYAEPRATIDIDINLFVEPSSYPGIERELAKIGIGDSVEPDIVQRDGQCRLQWGHTPIDLFFAYDDLHDAMALATRTEPFGNQTIPVLAPEHLLTCKAIFNRPKDWLDIEQMLVCVEDLDIDEIRHWLDRIVGADDPRREHFDRVLETLSAEPSASQT